MKIDCNPGLLEGTVTVVTDAVLLPDGLSTDEAVSPFIDDLDLARIKKQIRMGMTFNHTDVARLVAKVEQLAEDIDEEITLRYREANRLRVDIATQTRRAEAAEAPKDAEIDRLRNKIDRLQNYKWMYEQLCK